MNKSTLYRREIFLRYHGRYAYSSMISFFPFPHLYLNTEKSINDFLFSISESLNVFRKPRVVRELCLSLYHAFGFGLPLFSFDLKNNFNTFIPLSDLIRVDQLGEIKYGRGEAVG